jgi:hypothetical protein
MEAPRNTYPTKTLTENAERQITLTHTLISPDQHFLKKLAELKAIQESFKNHVSYKDKLSYRLHKWGKSVLNPKPKYQIQTAEELFNFGMNRIKKLMENILKNPIDRTQSFKKPIRDGDEWVWEEWMLKDYVEDSISLYGDAISPYTLEALVMKGDKVVYQKKQSPLMPHEYAQQMINWVNTLKYESRQEGRNVSNREIVPSQTLQLYRPNEPLLNELVVRDGQQSQRDLAQKLRGYEELTSIDKTEREKRIAAKQMKQLKETSLVQLQKLKNTSLQLLQQTKESEKKRDERVTQALNTLQKTSDQKIEIAHARLEDEKKHREVVEKHLAADEKIIEEQRGQIYNLSAQVQQQAQQIASLQNQACRGGGSCTII